MRGQRHPSVQRPRSEGGFHSRPKSGGGACTTKLTSRMRCALGAGVCRARYCGPSRGSCKGYLVTVAVGTCIVASFGLAQYLQPVRHVTTARLWSNRGGLWIEQHVCQRSVDGGRGCAHPAGRLVRCLCPAATFASSAASEDRASAVVKSWLALTAAGLAGRTPNLWP